jgi:predicted PurR-regulated permease PerM
MFLHPFITRLKKLKIPESIAIIIVYVVFIIIISFVMIILGSSFTNFIGDLPDITKNFTNDLLNILNKVYDIHIIKDNISIEELKRILKETISFDNFNTFVLKPINKTINFIQSFILFSFSLIFIIPWLESIYDKVLLAFPGKRGKKINEIILTIIERIQEYMSAKFIVSLITGFTCFIICLIFNVKYALLWGSIIFVLNFIPYIGSAIGVSLPVILHLLQYQSLLSSLLLLATLMVDNTLISYLLEPLIMSRGVNLNPLFIFISLLLWGFVWGIAGVLLAVPMMSACNLIFENIKPFRFISILISAKEKKLPKNNKDVKNSKK